MKRTTFKDLINKIRVRIAALWIVLTGEFILVQIINVDTETCTLTHRNIRSNEYPKNAQHIFLEIAAKKLKEHYETNNI